MSKVDDGFFNRADEHIHLSNEQMASISMGKVSSSMMYSVARFNAFVTASGSNSLEEMKKVRKETIAFFVTEYEKMLTENLDDYINHFDQYKNLNGYGRRTPASCYIPQQLSY